MVEYYTRLGFDYGVSVDHLIFAQTERERRARYELTIQNAAEFLREHRQSKAEWEPIGAVQGWNPDTYANAVADYIKMGYRHIAVGGLVRTTTPEILAVLERVHEKLRPGIKLHLFGLARFKAMRQFVQMGVTSVDSASLLRKAWLGSHINYLSEHGWYSAIRVPQLTASFRAKRAINNGAATEKVAALEKVCLQGLHAYGRARTTRVGPDLLSALLELDFVITGKNRKNIHHTILRTLEERPWQECGCEICESIGIDVVIFRGNNRNRRRGFHNTYVFYRLIDRLLKGERVAWLERDPKSKSSASQIDLFGQVLSNNR
jgi:queuine/archaeosine tRNA-ribosyltransferase